MAKFARANDAIAGGRNHYRPDIDGLRAVAVVAVMLYHAGLGVRGGFIGVDVFFVISGYLITSIIRRQIETGTFSFARFYERRARRILPALYLVTVFTLAVGWFVFSPAALKGLGGSVTATAVFASNFYFWRSSGGYFAIGTETLPLIHFWSLGIEEQFYFIWPAILVLAFARRIPVGWLIAVAFAASLALAEYAARAMPVANFFLLPMRAWELLGGAAIAFVATETGPRGRVRELLTAAGLGAICVPLVAFDDTIHTPGLLTAIPVGGTMILLACAPGTLVGRALESRLPVAIGLISYSAYLWHQPFLALRDAFAFDRRTPVESALVLAAALGAAVLTWKFVEAPFRDRDRISTRTIVVSAAVGGLALAAAGAATWLSGGWPNRLDASGRQLATMKRDYADGMAGCFFSPTTPIRFDTACREGAPPPSVAILGDSHALALRPAFHGFARDYTKGFVLIPAAGCPPVFDGRALSGLQTHCAPLYRDTRQWLRKHQEVRTVILVARWQYYLSRIWPDNERGGVEIGFRERANTPALTKATAEAYATSVRQMLDDGLEVVLVYPIPEAGWDVPEYLVKAQLRGTDAGRLSVSREWFRRRNAQAYAALDAIGQHPRLHRLYPEATMCDRTECALIENGRPLYFDANHVTSAGAARVMARLPATLGWVAR